MSRPGAQNSANYEVIESGSVTYTKNVADDNPDTMKPFVAYTASGQAQVNARFSTYTFFVCRMYAKEVIKVTSIGPLL